MKEYEMCKNLIAVLALSTVVTLGCGKDKIAEPKPAADKHEHAHAEEGPHGGHLIELGRDHKHHAEIVDHDETGRVEVYLLDHDMHDVAVKAESLSFTIQVNGETLIFELTQLDSAEAGDKTVFESTDRELLEALENPKATGKLRVTIDGAPFVGAIQGHAHGDEDHAKGHSHEGEDALVWREKGIVLGGCQILLGHHGEHLHAGEAVEPAVAITRNGEPVATAQVFNSLVDAKTGDVLAAESATVYEPPTDDEPAHYAQGELQIPAGLKQITIRYRIVLDEATGEKSFDVQLPVE
jgi:hypothetical protein